MDSQVEEIFIDALELDSKARDAFLAEACAGDSVLRERVARLLADAEKADAYFTESFGGGSRIPPLENSPMEGEGDFVGPFQLLRELGEGGFGVVWMAEQKEPIFRQVAIKVIKPGMDTRQVLTRFAAERQALARMDHPNIARVIDAGVTAAGRPYFAMELVRGIPITRFCEGENLDLKSRLKLFVGACEAIHHAHQKGIIHRDIKPSNILVEDSEEGPRVKVIDFGVAKATEGRLTDATLVTRPEQLLGTPLYMSPEQAGLDGQDIDTRSDIYGLGVLLYEMIAGAPPFDQSTLIRAGYEEMRRMIREVDPVRPSLRATHAATTSFSPAELGRNPSATHRSVPSDLDWIVMKAMDKSRDRRYGTVNALAEDIARFLSELPVSAKPPSSWYLFRKFAKRHRTAVWVGLGFVVLLVVSSVFSTWQAIRATRAETLSDRRLADAVSQRNAKDAALKDAEAVSRLFSEVMRRPSPEIDGRAVTVVQVLEVTQRELNEKYAGDPERHAMLLQVLAETYENLGLMEKAVEIRRKALEVLKSLGETSMRNYLDAAETLVSRFAHLGKYQEAADLAGETLPLREADSGKHDPATIRILDAQALNTFRAGDYEQAIDLQELLVERMLEAHPDEPSSAEEAYDRLIEFCEDSGNTQRLVELTRKFSLQKVASVKKRDTELPVIQDLKIELTRLQDVHTQLTNDLGKANSRTIAAQQQVALAMAKLGQSNEAIATQQEAVELSKATYGEFHPKTIEAIDCCRHICVMSAQWEKAWTLREQSAMIRREKFGVNHYESLLFQKERVFSFSTVPSRAAEGVVMAREALPQFRQVMGPSSRSYYNFSCNYARCLVAAGQAREAVEVLSIYCPKMSDDTWVNFLYAGLLVWFGEEEEYERLRSRMLDFWKPRRARETRFAYQLQRNAFLCTLLPFRNDEQRKEIAATVEKVESILNSPNCQFRKNDFHGPSWSRSIQGILHCKLGNHDAAIRQFDESMRISQANGSDSLGLERALDAIYRPLALYGLGRHDEARRMFLEKTGILGLLNDPNEPLRGISGADGGVDLALRISYDEVSKTLEIPKPEPAYGQGGK